MFPIYSYVIKLTKKTTCDTEPAKYFNSQMFPIETEEEAVYALN